MKSKWIKAAKHDKGQLTTERVPIYRRCFPGIIWAKHHGWSLPTSEANEYSTSHGLDLISQTGQKSHQSEMISL